MESYSVWNFPYAKRYYLTHPWKWFKDLGNNIRDAYRRARYGWTWSDCWNWDHWFIHIVPPMFRHMADHGCAYPGHEPFETSEKWHEWLHRIADLIETADEIWQDEHNEYHEEYMKHLMDNWKPPTKDDKGFYHHEPHERTELEEKYFARAKELATEGEENARAALTEIGEYFHDIWD